MVLRVQKLREWSACVSHLLHEASLESASRALAGYMPSPLSRSTGKL
jgi:hypothetical protein